MKSMVVIRCLTGVLLVLFSSLVAFGAVTLPKVQQQTMPSYQTGVPSRTAPVVRYETPIASVTLNPNAVYSGQSALGTIVLSAPAPNGGSEIALTTDNPALATIPAKITIAAGQVSGSFTAITKAGSSGGSAKISAFWGVGKVRSTILTIVPVSAQSTLSGMDTPAVTYTSQTLTGMVYLDKAAPSTGVSITLSSGNSSLVTVPNTVVVPSGQTTQTFPINTSAVAGSTRITAQHQVASRSNTIEVRPGTKVNSLKVQSPTKPSSQVTGTVQIAAPAPAGGAVIPLYIRNYNNLDVVIPPSVTVPAGQKSGTFIIQTKVNTGVAQIYTNISDYQADAACNEYLPSCARLDVLPPPKLSSIKALIFGCYKASGCDVGSLTAGTSFSLFVYTERACVDGISVDLSSSHPQIIPLPAQLNISGNSIYSFLMPVATMAVALPTTVTLSARYGGITKTVQFQVLPGPVVKAVAVTPGNIRGGSVTTGVVTLNQTAPAGGITVNLNSNNPSIVAVPVSVTIPVGQSSASFSLTSQSVLSNALVSVGASYAGQEKSTMLTITP